MGRRRVVSLYGKPLAMRMPYRKADSFFGTGLLCGLGFEELGSLVVRHRDRFLRELVPVVGVGWTSERILSDHFGPGLSERQPPPLVDLPFDPLGSWGSG